MVGYFFWHTNESKIIKSVGLLVNAYKLEAECSSKESFEFSIEPFDSAVVDPDCIKNATEFASLQGIDLKKTNLKNYCKCLKFNLDRVIEKYGVAGDQCLLVQAGKFVTNRCKELAVK
jgi:DNA-binding Lrp family transcriptional regulator